MTDKQSIEYTRPEGLPDNAVPYVGFVGEMDLLDGLYPIHGPNGEVRAHYPAWRLEQLDLPVPERTYEVTVRLTADEVEFFAITAPPDGRDLAPVRVYRKTIDAARAVLAAIEAGEA